jgi:DNA uptake protein ComE-like DNA-binding protein
VSNLNWLRQTPNWFWLSFIPVFGGLAIAYAGYKAKTSAWLAWGLGLTTVALITTSTSTAIYPLIWLLQIGTAFLLKKRYLIKTAPKGIEISDRETAELIAQTRGKININTCSKNELVYNLDLPIVYANEIDRLRQQGYIFTHLEELAEIAGVPESHLRKIAPLIVFSHTLKETENWERFNTFSEDDLIICGILPEAAGKIILERQKNGHYKSLADFKIRTRLPLSQYRDFL